MMPGMKSFNNLVSACEQAKMSFGWFFPSNQRLIVSFFFSMCLVKLDFKTVELYLLVFNVILTLFASSMTWRRSMPCWR